MREILFKAKTTKKISPIHEFNEKWVEGNLIKSDGRYYIHPLCNRVKMAGELGKIIVMHEVQMDTSRLDSMKILPDSPLMEMV